MIKVSTFCTGIGSPEQAFKELEVEHEVVFACEKDKYARTTYLANHACSMMFEDMTTMEMGGGYLFRHNNRWNTLPSLQFSRKEIGRIRSSRLALL